MSQKLMLGPLLGVESDATYTVCFLTHKSVTNAAVSINNQLINAVLVEQVTAGKFWRIEVQIAPQQISQSIEYRVVVDGVNSVDQNQNDHWVFYVPGQDEKPRMAYASCNGFSDATLVNSTERPYALWQEMRASHVEQPFSMLIMGGDQVYADAIWTRVKPLEDWNELGRAEKTNRKATKAMKEQVDRFYGELYCNRWNKADIAHMLATVPTVMMWDDHDIFDGWGSYPTDIQGCDVYSAIYSSAARYFKLFQLRSLNNKSLLDQGNTTPHYSFGFTFRGYTLLAMDNRSQRSITKVMGSEQWADIARFLDNNQQASDLLVLSAVPVVYRDFSFTESMLDTTPWEEELTDDLKDHWRAKEHQGERAKLIMRLLDNAAARKSKTVILSGDVHVGCFGVIRDSRGNTSVNIHQVVSSGIVHPAPSCIQWLGIQAVTNDRTEYLNEDRTVRIDMLKPHGSTQYLRTRNFVTLQEGTDNKLWINWVCENKEKPMYPLQASNR